MINRVAVLSITVLLAGCDLPAFDLPTLAVKPTTYHTVAYYDTHALERDQANAWCGNNPGLATGVASCASADQAGANAFNRKMGWLK
jgi:hypothetical protein